jgi:hypothetical protein
MTKEISMKASKMMRTRQNRTMKRERQDLAVTRKRQNPIVKRRKTQENKAVALLNDFYEYSGYSSDFYCCCFVS